MHKMMVVSGSQQGSYWVKELCWPCKSQPGLEGRFQSQMGFGARAGVGHGQARGVQCALRALLLGRLLGLESSSVLPICFQCYSSTFIKKSPNPKVSPSLTGGVAGGIRGNFAMKCSTPLHLFPSKSANLPPKTPRSLETREERNQMSDAWLRWDWPRHGTLPSPSQPLWLSAQRQDPP